MLANSFLRVLSAFFVLLCAQVAFGKKKRLQTGFALFDNSETNHKNQS